ncbi:conserved hypothetical protein [Culex quinquefasciatus]|uniref:Uncharacterized protein n=1 Tax=Culex quinquefasciatus TaxID=7176 RepID=B0XA74_CULQU|nr:conserved hypothetical protein [Culex quinquefasciatus]|eukprot:XP_001866546.1 conserved hypothetical protein [Culex quinquefasciatus]
MASLAIPKAPKKFQPDYKVQKLKDKGYLLMLGVVQGVLVGGVYVPQCDRNLHPAGLDVRPEPGLPGRLGRDVVQ